jgi:hypothetical protein
MFNHTVFNYSWIPRNANAPLLSVPLGKPPHSTRIIILGGVIKYVVIFIVST